MEIVALVEQHEQQNLVQTLKRIGDRKLAEFSADCDPLRALDPAQHSVAYFYILCARLGLEKQPNLVSYCCDLFKSSFKVAAHDLQVFADRFDRLVMFLQNYKRAALAMKMACISLADDGSFTPFHTLLVKYCLLAKTFTFALQVIEKDILQINDGDHVKLPDVLAYFYYSGRIFLGLKMFTQAREAFLMCISCPAVIVSKIQIESYKRLVLLDLILDGDVSPMPRYIFAIVARSLRHHSAAYLDFSKAYVSGHYSRIEECVASNEKVFQMDTTSGLVAETIKAFFSRKIKKLTQTYLTISLEDIQKSIGPQAHGFIGDLETHILKMVQQKQINVYIDHSEKGLVTAKDDADEFDGLDVAANLDAEIQRVAILRDQLEQLDREMALSKDYLMRKSLGSDEDVSRIN